MCPLAILKGDNEIRQIWGVTQCLCFKLAQAPGPHEAWYSQTEAEFF